MKVYLKQQNDLYDENLVASLLQVLTHCTACLMTAQLMRCTPSSCYFWHDWLRATWPHKNQYTRLVPCANYTRNWYTSTYTDWGLAALDTIKKNTLHSFAPSLWHLHPADFANAAMWFSGKLGGKVVSSNITLCNDTVLGMVEIQRHIQYWANRVLQLAFCKERAIY